MELKVGKYTLKSDRFCAWIEEDFKIKEGKSKGKVTQKRVSGYCRDFGTLLDDFIDNKVRDADSNSMADVLAEIDSALKDAKKIARAAVKDGFEIIRDVKRENK